MKRHDSQTKRRDVCELDDAKGADGLARPHFREGAPSTIPEVRRASGSGTRDEDDDSRGWFHPVQRAPSSS